MFRGTNSAYSARLKDFRGIIWRYNMTDFVKVKGHSDLHRDVNSNAVINTNVSEYSLYMKRIKTRQKDNDKFKNAVREINNLKHELREIKTLIKEIVNK